MHLVAKQLKGHEYFYLVEKGRREGRVVTVRTVYIGDRQRLAEVVQRSVSTALPSAFVLQSVGATLALATIATELGVESLIDQVCPVRAGAAPIGRRLVLAAIHRVVAARRDNGLHHLRTFYEGSVLAELMPMDASALDDQRMCEVLGRLTSSQIEQIEAAVVRCLVERERVTTEALAFDCTNFDSYAGAKTRSRLLQHLQELLERQRQGQRRHKPLTVAAVKRRADAALAREHMRLLFHIQIAKGEGAPTLGFEEQPEVWRHLQDYELGRTLLVTNRADWSAEQIVHASRLQSHNERLFRDLKDPAGVSMLPLRHRCDHALRAHALIVVLGLILGRVVQRRVRQAGLKAPTLASLFQELQQVQRARVQFSDDAAPALRALAADTWIASKRTPRQQELLPSAQHRYATAVRYYVDCEAFPGKTRAA